MTNERARDPGACEASEEPEEPGKPRESASVAPDECLRILLVDDHAAVRDSLERLLREAGGVPWRIFTADGGPSALVLLETQAVDVAVVDMSMPGMNGFELIGELSRRHPGLPALMLSLHDEEPYALRALQCGARGYLMKDRAATELVPVLRKVLTGGVHLSAPLARRVLVPAGDGLALARHAHLSAREFEVLRRLSAGEPADAIGEAMRLPMATVATTQQRVMDKLGLATLPELRRYGAENGLGDPEPQTSSPPPPHPLGRLREGPCAGVMPV